jgi:hypothetical protein
MKIDEDISGEEAIEILEYLIIWHPELKEEIDLFLRFRRREREELQSIKGE